MGLNRYSKGFQIGFYSWIAAQSLLACALLFLPDIRGRLVGTLLGLQIAAWAVTGGLTLIVLLLPDPLFFYRTIPQLSFKTVFVRFVFFFLNSASEEVIWRGGSFYFSGKFPFAVVATVASLGFALVHYLPQGKRGLFVHFGTGIIFSLLAGVTGGLLAPFIAHLIYNSSMIGKTTSKHGTATAEDDLSVDLEEIPTLEFKNIAKSYGEKVGLRGVSFAISPGEVVALLGQNGAGKTTLLEILVGLREADSGSIRINGISVAGRDTIRSHRLGVILQDNRLPPKLTVRETLDLFASFATEPMPLEELISRFELKHILARYTENLSGGERQLVSLAVASIEVPILLILDEPTNALDPKARQIFWRQVKVMRESGCAVLFATHQMEEAQELSSRVVILHNGKIVADDAVRAIRATASAGFKFKATFERVNGKNGFSHANSEELMEVPIASVDAGVELAERLRTEGRTFSSFGIERPSLREAFFELTGEVFDK